MVNGPLVPSPGDHIGESEPTMASPGGSTSVQYVNREPHIDDHSDITDDSQGGSVEIYCNVCKCACNADGNKNWFKCTVGLTPECSKSDFGAK